MEHNKFKSCKDCPDRCAEPNCHDTCEGYIHRTNEWHSQKEERMRNIELWEYKHERINADIQRRRHQKRKRYK